MLKYAMIQLSHGGESFNQREDQMRVRKLTISEVIATLVVIIGFIFMVAEGGTLKTQIVMEIIGLGLCVVGGRFLKWINPKNWVNSWEKN